MIKDETRDSRSRARKPFLSSFPLPLRTEMEIENLRKPSEFAILVAADFLFSPRSSNRGRGRVGGGGDGDSGGGERQGEATRGGREEGAGGWIHLSFP